MKLLTTLTLTILLSACSAFQARTYDPVEYNYAVMITSNTTHATHRCNDMSNPEYNMWLQEINHDTLTLVEFVSDKSDTDQAVPSVIQIRDMTSTFLNRTNYSITYCQHKLSNIQSSARTFARAISGNEKYNMCQSDVQSRYDLFAKSYNANLIRKDEFDELVGDLLKLKTIDTSGCTLEERAKMQHALEVIQSASKLLGVL